jgi:hypothetical protein
LEFEQNYENNCINDMSNTIHLKEVQMLRKFITKWVLGVNNINWQSSTCEFNPFKTRMCDIGF